MNTSEIAVRPLAGVFLILANGFFVAIGATGRSGLREHLLGSTADRVARSVDASVLLARP